MKNNPTCAITGRKDNLQMFAHRNDEGDMVGWFFISEGFMFPETLVMDTKFRSLTKNVYYRNYRIVLEPNPIGEIEYWHESYDGPEDKRCGSAKDVLTVCKQIDSLIDGD
jgi:hypothetical protein